MFDRVKYKQFALIQLKGRFKVPILMTLITIAVSTVFNIPSTFLPDFFSDFSNYLVKNQNIDFNFVINSLPDYYVSFAVNGLCSVLCTVVLFIFTMASTTVYLQMSKSPSPVTFSLYKTGLKKWAKALGTGLYEYLWVFIWALICVPVTFLVCVIIVLMYNAGCNESLMSLAVTAGSLAICASCIPSLIKWYAYSQAMMLAAEFDAVGPVKALNLSKIITDGHKMDLFVMALSFIGWIFLVAITYGIAGLYVNPYISMTEINAYHALLKEAVHKGKIKMSDLGLSEDKPEDAEAMILPETPAVSETPASSETDTSIVSQDNSEAPDSSEEKSDSDSGKQS